MVTFWIEIAVSSETCPGLVGSELEVAGGSHLTMLPWCPRPGAQLGFRRLLLCTLEESLAPFTEHLLAYLEGRGAGACLSLASKVRFAICHTEPASSTRTLHVHSELDVCSNSKEPNVSHGP